MASTDKKIQKMELDITQVTRTQSLLNRNQIQKLWNTTPTRNKYTRKARGGGEWTYIKIGYVRQVLDSVFGFNWTFDVETSVSEAFEVAKLTKVCVVKGTVTGRVKVDGEWVELSKTQFGRAEVKFKTEWNDVSKKKIPTNETLDFGNDMKAAATDALKKCASLFGIGGDIYDGDDFMEIEITGSSENTDRAKLTKKELEKVQKELEVEEVGEVK